ncbi:hypothetical protein [Streptomyces sp. NPDC003667]
MYWVVFKGAAREVYSRLMDSADPALVDTAETALRDAEGPWPWPWPTVAPGPRGPAATAARRCPGIRDRAYSNAFREQGRPHETGMRCTRSPAGS